MDVIYSIRTVVVDELLVVTANGGADTQAVGLGTNKNSFNKSINNGTREVDLMGGRDYFTVASVKGTLIFRHGANEKTPSGNGQCWQ